MIVICVSCARCLLGNISTGTQPHLLAERCLKSLFVCLAYAKAISDACTRELCETQLTSLVLVAVGIVAPLMPKAWSICAVC